MWGIWDLPYPALLSGYLKCSHKTSVCQAGQIWNIATVDECRTYGVTDSSTKAMHLVWSVLVVLLWGTFVLLHMDTDVHSTPHINTQRQIMYTHSSINEDIRMTLCCPLNFKNKPIKRQAIKHAFIGFVASEKRAREREREKESVC